MEQCYTQKQSTRSAFLAQTNKPNLTGVKEAGWILAKTEDAVRELARSGKLDVVGGYHRGCRLLFLTDQLLQLAKDAQWQDEAVKHLRQANRKKNQAAKAKRGEAHG